MKLSRKLKRKIKKRILTVCGSTALILSIIASTRVSNILLHLNSAKKVNDVQAETVTNRIPNSDTVTYIYDATDFVVFRDAVNAGDNYSGKTVYLMNDIDLSSVCSSTLGSWTPIGANGKLFAGTFDGNYHTISNLYIKTGSYANVGLFAKTATTTIIQNVTMKDPSVYNSYTAYSRTAALVGFNYGKIVNCASVGGAVTAYQTTTATAYKAVVVGGVVGYNEIGTVLNSFNTSSISGTANTSNSYCLTRVGGTVGSNNGGIVSNCYNGGTVTGKGYIVCVGGAVGMTYSREDTTVKPKVSNLYNYGTLKATEGTAIRIGGVTATNGTSAVEPGGTVTNSYCTDDTTYSSYY